MRIKRRERKRKKNIRTSTCSRKRDNFNQDYDGYNRYSMVLSSTQSAYPAIHIYRRHKVTRFDLSGIKFNRQLLQSTCMHALH